MIRVLIVDDHTFIRAGVAGVLREAQDILVVGECADGAEVPAMAVALLPDVVLMDIRMPVVSGTDATRALMAKHPTIRVVMLTGSMNARTVAEAADAGAVGYLVKDGDPGLLVSAVRSVAGGGTAWPSDAIAVNPTPGAAQRIDDDQIEYRNGTYDGGYRPSPWAFPSIDRPEDQIRREA